MKYRVPKMAEIRAVPWNGFNVVSTFSGAGGSCLGYRMAGFRVVWANEFIPAAQEVYRLNHPDTFLNCDNIRDVSAAMVAEQSGLGVGEIDLLDGSPPCASFSTAGSREKHWGHEKAYSDTKQRVDDLFFEYVRLIRELQPKTFVAENVSGLVKGTAKGVFKQVIHEMKECGYEVSARLLNAKFLGVPQSRERLIFVGVRNDICEQFGVRPAHPSPEQHVYTLADALNGLEQDERQRELLLDKWSRTVCGKRAALMPKNPKNIIQWNRFSGTSGSFNLCRLSMHKPANTVLQTCSNGAAMPMHPLEDRPFTIPELKRVMSVPDDFILTGKFEQQWERLGRMVPPVMMSKIGGTVESEILSKTRI